MVSAQRAVDGESAAGKYTVEWTSEGEQKSLYVPGQRIFMIFLIFQIRESVPWINPVCETEMALRKQRPAYVSTH